MDFSCKYTTLVKLYNYLCDTQFIRRCAKVQIYLAHAVLKMAEQSLSHTRVNHRLPGDQRGEGKRGGGGFRGEGGFGTCPTTCSVSCAAQTQVQLRGL